MRSPLYPKERQRNRALPAFVLACTAEIHTSYSPCAGFTAKAERTSSRTTFDWGNPERFNDDLRIGVPTETHYVIEIDQRQRSRSAAQSNPSP